jgi:hypothetical protein
MTDLEKYSAGSISRLVDRIVKDSGYDDSVRKNLSVTFRKAVLTISEEEARSGAGHSLADGKPFYRMEISAGDKTIFDAENDQTAALVFYLMQALGSGSVPLSGPLVLEHDFRGDLAEKGMTVASYIRHLQPVVVRSRPPAGPKPH